LQKYFPIISDLFSISRYIICHPLSQRSFSDICRTVR
jgi:hypothetical protein